MTFTYSGTPLSNTRDEIRELMGDTNRETSLVSDELIEYALSEASNNKFRTCAIICDTLAVRFARDADIRVSTYATDRRSISDKYRAMAMQFRNRARTGDAFRMPAMKLTSKNNSFDDTDIVQPMFKRGLHEFENTEDELADN